ncbi:MAG: hypothetical protein PHP31_00300 [Lentimicrobiaceae bacterium]|jgi:hypothetical protein|nr:hypothetical protein [Lentimicrobiaceae bacterium]
MDIDALIFMIAVEGTVIFVALYYFLKVLNTKPKDEPDSYTDE